MNYKFISASLMLILIVIAIKACIFSETIFNLNEDNIEAVESFQELPIPVKDFITQNISQIVHSQKVINHSIDSSIIFYYGEGGRGATWLNEVSSNFGHFFIDGLHYRLGGNHGNVFILYKNEIYFSEIMIYETDYMQRNYFSIELPVE